MGVLVGLAGIYVGTAKLGLLLEAVSGFATLVWPPTGIALAALVLGGAWLWPCVAAGAFLVNAAASRPSSLAGRGRAVIVPLAALRVAGSGGSGQRYTRDRDRSRSRRSGST